MIKKPFSASHFVVNGTRLLRLYSVYSLFLAILLLVITALDQNHTLLGNDRPLLMLASSLSYVGLAAIFTALAVTNPDPQVTTGFIFIEIVLLVCMMLATGGLGTGFTSLIAIAVVVSNLLTPGVLGYGAAAWTTIALIYTQLFIGDNFDSQDSLAVGLYGFLCFILSWITQSLARRLKSALTLTSSQAQHIQRLQRISQQALQSLPSAIVACDEQYRIVLLNQQAKEWFLLQQNTRLPDFLNVKASSYSFRHRQQSYIAKRIELSELGKDYFLLNIDSSEQVSAAAQQMKLASLGRLTASIAHEIRNPLSALKQAAQLFSEADYLQDTERQLSQIIEVQSDRINKVIEDILQLSRRKQAQPNKISLSTWLEQFKQQFQQLQHEHEFQFTLVCPQAIEIAFDSSQLQQVLYNLCTNGLRYALKNSASNARLSLVVQTLNNNKVQLDVLDNGGGISKELQQHLFEPFYTSEHNGTGLGLYLCRELCEANQASIHYYAIPNGACFRIIINTR